MLWPNHSTSSLCGLRIMVPVCPQWCTRHEISLCVWRSSLRNVLKSSGRTKCTKRELRRCWSSISVNSTLPLLRLHSLWVSSMHPRSLLQRYVSLPTRIFDSTAFFIFTSDRSRLFLYFSCCFLSLFFLLSVFVPSQHPSTNPVFYSSV